MIKNIILASRSKVRKKILEENNIKCEIIPSNIDENLIKESLIREKINKQKDNQETLIAKSD